ncbi:MAG: ABC transporter ATP-binding protein [Prochloraceae cyanobacterium]|nr:ABC transporter ATP-binding protein [Prochloraceae cyanobacterium]
MNRSAKKSKQKKPSLWRILGKFWPQIRQQRFLLIVSFLALVAETGLQVIEPWPLKFIFDNVILTGFHVSSTGISLIDKLNPMELLTLLVFLMVAIVGVRGAASYFSTVSMAIATSRVMSQVRSNLYSHLQRLSLAFHHQAKNGDTIARVTSDIEQLQEVTVVAVLPLLTSILTMVGMVGVMFWIDAELALIIIAAFPIFIFSSERITKGIRNAARSSRKRQGAMAATAAEALGAIKVVQALSLQGTLERNFHLDNQKSLQESAQAQKLKAVLQRTVDILVAIVTALILWRGVQLVLQQAISPGELLVFMTYLRLTFKPMRQIAKYIGQIAKAIASGERILDLLEVVPEIRDLRGAIEAPSFEGGLRFNNVTFAYQQSNIILRNITFEAKPKQRVALVGASGGGKSTMVSLLLRLYDPLEGQILIDGRDLREYKIDSLRQQISIVLQDSVLFSTNIRENIAYGRLGATDREIETAARLANAHDFIMAMPSGYDTVIGERGSTLSGGQRQRIAIARAVLRKAPIVILDEPTVGLDNENERAVSEALEKLTENSTTFLITHDLRTAVKADLIIYIEKGEIVERGTHSQLMKAGDRYANLYRLQTALSNNDVYNKDSDAFKTRVNN